MRNLKVTTKKDIKDAHPFLSWLTRHLFMGSTTMTPEATCRICANAIPAEVFKSYREGQVSSGCTVIMVPCVDKVMYNNMFVSLRMRMTNFEPGGTSDDLKITFTTRMYEEQLEEYSDGVDIRTTRTIYNVSSLSIAKFRDLFNDAVAHHYSFIPNSKQPLTLLVRRMFEEM